MSHVKVGIAAAAAALAVAACSTSHKPATSHTAKPPAVANPTSTTPTATPAATAAAATGLSGKWSGQYSGAYQGTFVLTWRQTGSRLTGRITISNPHSTLAIHGTVSGGAIQFGTVGGAAITYKGTVSGSSMSGTYQVGLNGNGSGGPWSASRS